MQLWNEGPRGEEMLPLLEEATAIYADLEDPVMEGRALQPTVILHRTDSPERAADAMKRLQSLLPRVAERGPSRDKVLFYHFLGNVYMTTGDYPETVQIAERGVEAARALGDEGLLTHMELRRADALGTTGQVGEAIRVAQEVLPRAEAMGDLETLGEALFDLAEFSMIAGHLELSREYRQREQALYERQGRTFEAAFALCNLGQVEVYLGNWQAVRDYVERGLAMAEAVDNQFVPRIGKYFLGALSILQGNWDEGGRVLEEIEAQRIGTLQIHRYIQGELARLDLLRGHPERALARLEPLVEGANPADSDVTLLLPVLAWAYLENGNDGRAVEGAAEAIQRARAQQNALALVDALRVFGMALAQQDRAQEAAAAFEEDLALGQRMPYPYAEATALFEWGSLDAASDDPGQARARLEDALAIFTRLGARKDVERTERAVKELGA
jgi:tetratricopeptide (TPR) repeat protein